MNRRSTSDPVAAVQEIGERQRPLHMDVGNLIENVGSILTELYGTVPGSFIIAGSFAAAVIAWHNYKVNLHYNDVDVFVVRSSQERSNTTEACGYSIGRDRSLWIQNVRTMDGVLNGSRVPVNIVELHDTIMTNRGRKESRLSRLVGNFDINCVMVGFRVERDETYEVWKIGEWEIKEPFLKFMATETLAIPNAARCKSIIHSVIRMVKKSCELHLRMELPEPDKLCQIMQSHTVPDVVVKKWHLLPEAGRSLPHFKDIEVDGPLEPRYEGQKTEYYRFKKRKSAVVVEK